jgi:hypothetical protein
MGMILLPAAAGTCPVCAVAHDPRLPHDATPLFYGMRFRLVHGRDVTWADAAAHCGERLRAAWRQAMREKGLVWTEPPAGVDPIADPPHDSLGGLLDTGIEPVVVSMREGHDHE